MLKIKPTPKKKEAKRRSVASTHTATTDSNPLLENKKGATLL